MPIVERIIKENTENHEAYVYQYTKLNAEPGEKQYYGGSHKGKPSDDYHHSAGDDQLDLDISKYDFKYEVLHYGTLGEMKTKEHTILSKVDAAKNPEWYNNHNGSPGDVKEIDLRYILDMAEEIRETNAYRGIVSVVKTYIKKTMRSDIKKAFGKIQVRKEQLLIANSRKITSWLDKHNGSLKTLWEKEKINLIVVVLKGLVDDNGDTRDIIIGGNHTIDGTLNSKHGREIRYLTLPFEVHGLDYNKAKQLGSFLNKPVKQPGEVNDEGNILKSVISLCEDFGYDSKSEQVDESLDFQECDPAQKKRIKTKLTKLLKKNHLANQMWLMYDTADGKAELEKMKAKLLKTYPKARIFVASSGLVNIGKMMVDLNNEIRGGLVYDKVIFLIHHPSPEDQQKWFSDYLVGNKDFVEMNCEKMADRYSKIKKLQSDFIYMDTLKSDLN